VRRMNVDKNAGLRRVAWNFASDPTPEQLKAAQDAAAQAAAGGAAGRGGRGGAPGGGGGGGGRGGGRGGGGGPTGPAVEPGRYFAQLVKVTGDTVTPVGGVQSFAVVPLPEKN